MRLFNSLTGRIEEFRPLTPGEVRMYVCGLTVSDDAHLGHGRSAAIFDLLRRVFRYQGSNVLYVRNVTDVDDKIVERARFLGETPAKLVERYMARHAEDLERLRVPRADIEPRASEHVGEMIDFIKELIARKAAFEKDGSVWFRVRSVPDFGFLAQRAGETALMEDFLLWKRETDASCPGWNSPWGRGCPGWHIECSTMSMKILGETFDIHGGGEDLRHPHHDSEIAQSEALSGKPLARIFMHHALVYLEEEKMSKSSGKFFTLREIFGRFDPAVVRYYLFRTHYRTRLKFSPAELEPSRRAIERMEEFLRRSSGVIGPSPEKRSRTGDALCEVMGTARSRILAALESDLDTDAALTVLDDLIAAGEEHLECAAPDPFILGRAEEFLDEMDEIFDLRRERTRTLTRRGQLVESMLAVRKKLIASGDAAALQAANDVRLGLEKVGVEVIDSPWGTRWKWE